MKKTAAVVLAAAIVTICLSSAKASLITENVFWDTPVQVSSVQEPEGLSDLAIFILDTEKRRELKIELFNSSTGLPAGLNSTDEILNGISLDLGEFGSDAAYPTIPEPATIVMLGLGGECFW